MSWHLHIFLLSGLLHKEDIRQHQPLQHILPVGLHISHDTGHHTKMGISPLKYDIMTGCYILHTEVYLALNGRWTDVIPSQGGARWDTETPVLAVNFVMCSTSYRGY